jgi:hypothetical protein
MLDVVQGPAPAQDVVGDVEDVIRLPIRARAFEESDVRIDQLLQAELADESVHQGNPAHRSSPNPAAHGQLFVAARHHRTALRAP